MTTFNTPPLAPRVTVHAAIPSPPPFPNIGQAVLLTLMLLAAQILSGMSLASIGLLLGSSPREFIGTGALGLVNILSFAAVLVIGVYWGKVPVRQAIPLGGIPIGLLLPFAVTVIGLSTLLSDLSNLILLLLPPPDWVDEMFAGLLGGDEGPMWQSVVLLTFIAPLTEEPIFRSLMLNGLLKEHRPRAAISVAALLFAVMHLNPWQFFPALALGLLFGWWFWRTRSLWPGIIGHALNNSLPLLAAPVLGLDIPGYTGSVTDAVQFQPLWFDLAGLAVFTLGLAWTQREFRRLPAPPAAPLRTPPIALPITLPIAQPVPLQEPTPQPPAD